MPQRGGAQVRRFLAAVLFSDIVGSTEQATRLGDREWLRLLEQHNAVVRRQLRVFRGREMNTAGDGFFAVFSTPAEAVRCAASLAPALAPLGIRVRAGVHMGECETLRGKVGGVAVNVGARIAALAGAGEVLVSSNVRDMTVGSGLRFESLGERSLKGVPEAWRVYRLLDGVPAGAGDVIVSTPAAPLPVRRMPTRLLAAAVVGVLVVAAGAVFAASQFVGGSTVRVADDTVGVLSEDGERATAAIPVGQRPVGIAGGAGAVWVANSGSNTVSRIEPSTHHVFPVRVGEQPTRVAVGAGAVWVTDAGDSTVSRIDPRTYEVTTVPACGGPSDVVVAGGSVWVACELDRSVVQIDPDRNAVTHVVPVGGGPAGMAYAAGNLWVTNQADDTVSVVDVGTRQVDEAIEVGRGPEGIAAGAGAVWVANDLDGSVSRIDVTDHGVQTRTVSPAGGAFDLATEGSSVWVSNEYDGSLTRLDLPSLDRAWTRQTHASPLGVTRVGGRVWFTAAAGGGGAHDGGTLTLSTTSVSYDHPSLDPAGEYSTEGNAIFAITNDGLVTYRRTAGIRGTQLVPDLATSIPKPSDGGRTYVFHLRRGIRYSTGDPVRAGDIRHGIERTLKHDDGTWGYYTGIVGGQACHDKPSACDLDAGIVTDDRAGTVTFHLTEPDPEFLYKLAGPGACAVPLSVADHLPNGGSVPSTGPYRVASFVQRRADKQFNTTRPGQLVLVRNPRFHVWSAAAQPRGNPDRIVVDIGPMPARGIRDVEKGRADLVLRIQPRLDTTGLITRRPNQVHLYPSPYVLFIFLNTTVPPFDNVAARRAVAYALDRRALATADGPNTGTVTCQFLPPDLQGHVTYCPYSLATRPDQPWAAPDLETARQLVAASGTGGARVDVPTNHPLEPVLRPVVAVLDALGYRARLRHVRIPDYIGFTLKRSKEIQVGFTNWGVDYPATSNFFQGVATCGPLSLNPAWFCALEPEIHRARTVQVADPARAARLWAEIDHKLVDAAAMIPFAIMQVEDVTGTRVGNYQRSPQLGALLAQIWLR